jgi:hypothetical protein
MQAGQLEEYTFIWYVSCSKQGLPRHLWREAKSASDKLLKNMTD